MASINRFSSYSNVSAIPRPNQSGAASPNQTTTTLLNALHNTYTTALPLRLDSSTSVVVNTWVTATQTDQHGIVGGTVDPNLAARAWEHARRRAEDGCVVLASLHQSTPSVLVPFLRTLPIAIPPTLYTALQALQPFLHALSPHNASAPHHSALAVTLTLSLSGSLMDATIALSQSGIDTSKGLLNVPQTQGYRAFDVFYYLLISASKAERDNLELKDTSAYDLLAKSATYDPPSYLPTADDAAAADDWRAALKAIGVKGTSFINLLSVLSGILMLGNSLGPVANIEQICEDAGDLLDLDPEVLSQQCEASEREAFLAGLYEALVDWVIVKANAAITTEASRLRDESSTVGDRDGTRTPTSSEEDGDTVALTVLEISRPDLGKAAAMRGVFDDGHGINCEMKEDGVDVSPIATSILREMEHALVLVGPDLGIASGSASQQLHDDREVQRAVLDKISRNAEDNGVLQMIVSPSTLTTKHRVDLSTILSSSRAWYHLSVHPTDALPASLTSPISSWQASTVSRQLRDWRLPEWANRRNKNLDFTSDFDHDEFYQRYAPLGCKDGKDGIESWILERGWSNGEVVIGHERIWMRESAWWEAEGMLDLKPDTRNPTGPSEAMLGSGILNGNHSLKHQISNPFFPTDAQYAAYSIPAEQETLLPMSQEHVGHDVKHMTSATRSLAPTRQTHVIGDYGLGSKGDNKREQTYYNNEIGEFVHGMDPEMTDPKAVTTQSIDFSRRVWVGVIWALTFWIPSFLLRFIGRMKRPDVRFAWREKLVLFAFIAFMNGLVLFWIIGFGRLLCPNFDKAWNAKEVATHGGENDFYVSIRGHVYDISKFWKISHGSGTTTTTQATMLPFAGLNLDEYFQPPLITACPGLDIAQTTTMLANTTVEYSNALHTSGYLQSDTTSPLYSTTWYWDVFQPAIKEYYKGDLVVSKSAIQEQGEDGYNNWVILNGKIYDLTDYFYTQTIYPSVATYQFLDSTLTDLIKKAPGTDITDSWTKAVASANSTEKVVLQNNLKCLDQVFYAGIPDFRQTIKCTINNYILLAFTIILCAVILIKFLAALQFGSRRKPPQQDKFVICQVPAYTEDENSLRKAIDSLTALQYDNKRKLICIICDGLVIGGGNDRPTPKIVLDILGVDPKMDPPVLAFHSVGESNEQLNFGKVYSGLYEFEGNVVPYLVIVKVGKESEQTKSKPGNRGKRDSQILLMSFLNRVHHRSPMNPLELEMFHQINNIIGVDPELYEYVLMIDADTSVREDSLNRLVAKCANDNRIAGICGETSLENEERSWWTMIQVYEYFISHHLAKAFESLFGSVTCLPGCFTMYRLRTADKGKPLLISDAVIKEYSDCYVDTLHKKNLLSLGEDRFLTTLMTKHFPYMTYKFIPDAFALTAAPETWSVLLSQRRRWINSTIHNLFELFWLKDMCGFCCFSMRFVVLIDLFGTIILPSTVGYIIYLIWSVTTGKGQFPLISICMIAATYGLQALIFLLKRQWQHIGWMIIYLLAFPIYSLVLPVYSFWNQDNFSWGNTRIVIGEKGNKQIVALDDEGFDPRSVPLTTWDHYATVNNLPGRRNGASAEKNMVDNPYEDTYELDEMKSMYSSVKPASTILSKGPYANVYAAPQTPTPYAMQQRQSQYSINPYGDHAAIPRNQSAMSLGHDLRVTSPYQDNPYRGSAAYQSSENLLGGMHSPRNPYGYTGGSRSLLDPISRPVSTFDFQRGNAGPDDQMIVDAIRNCLSEVDLDSVTKKQVRALVEQRLQSELSGERRTFLDRMIDTELAAM